MANEETKFGITCEEVRQLVQDVAKLPNICIKGLMTIAPFVQDAEENRIYFSKLKKLAVDIMEENMENLSMGMTGDYGVAVSEGATYVRVGTGIFGVRQYVP